MFEAAELGRTIPKAEFEELVPMLRIELLEIQQELRGADFPVIILFAGVDGAGKGETVNVLNEWMDPRWMRTRAYPAPSEEEAERPEFWRYWRDLPPKGTIGFFLSSWYSAPVLNRVYGEIDANTFHRSLDRIVDFEQALADDGALIMKFWMHLGKKAQRKRFKTLEKNPELSWRVTERDWRHWKMYDDFASTAEQTIMRTSTGPAPWTIVEGVDERYRSITVARFVRDNIRKQLKAREIRKKVEAETRESRGKDPRTESFEHGAAAHTILHTLDMSRVVSKKSYASGLNKEQGRLNLLSRHAKEAGKTTVLLFEGWDAGGKGGAIRRLTRALDARSYQVHPVAAPTDEERAQHYLWRFWRYMPRAGRFSIFDRSWYGRVLVERVEGFATEPEWMRAYAEINHFEEQLVEHGMVLVKFWVHITQDEQLRRFKGREEIPYKRWKLTDEDWRNREQWPAYEQAVNDMVERTSTSIAPWTLVEGNDKRHARLKVLRTVADALEQGLGLKESTEEPTPSKRKKKKSGNN